MKAETFPDITMRDDLPAPTVATVGQLAALVQAVAADPSAWLPHVRFDPAERVRVQLDDGLWLITWPPGFRLAAHAHDGAAQLLTVLAGELAELTFGEDGAAARPLRPNRTRVQPATHMHEVLNPGPTYAITLHAYSA